MTVGELMVRMGVDQSQFNKAMSKAEGQAKAAGSKIGDIFKNAFSVAIGMGMFEALKRGFKTVVGTAIDFNSMLQTAKIGFTTMLGSAEKAQAFLNKMADFAAKTPFEYPDLLQATKRMLAYGFAADEVLPTLRAIGDATAALGMGSEGIDRIALALGQMRAKGKVSGEEMRQLAEAGIPAWEILAESIGKTTAETMKLAEKGAIPASKAINALVTGMSNRFGGMMRQMENTWQGVTSTIRDVWRMTVSTLTGTLFTGLNNMLIKVRDFMIQFNVALQAIMGKKAAANAGSMTQQTQKQAGAVQGLGEAYTDAQKAAKGSVADFDEVHNIIEETADAGGVIGGAEVGGVKAIEAPISEETTEPANKILATFEKIKMALQPVIDAFTNLKAAAEPVINNIGQGLRWFYDNVLAPFGSWIIAEAVPAFLGLLSGALTVLNPILEAFKPLGQWLWENFLFPIANWTGDAFIGAMNVVTEAFRRLGNWMSQNKEKVTAGLEAILGGILAYKVITGIPTVIEGVKTALYGLNVAFGALTSPIGLVALAIAGLIAGFIYFYTTNEKFRGVVDSVLNAIRDAALFLWQYVLVPLGQFLGTVFVTAWNVVTTAAQWLWQNVLVPFGAFLSWLWRRVILPVGRVLLDVLGVAFQTVADIAQSFWNNVLVPLGNALKEMFQPAVEAVSAVLDFLWHKIFVPLGEFLTSIFKPIIEGLIKVFEFLWYNVLKPLANFVGGIFVNVFDSMFRSIKDIINGLKNIFIGLMSFISGVFTGNWEKAWEGVRQIFKGVFDSLWGIVKFPLNLIIGGINQVIKALNSIQIDIPSWVPIFGGKSFGINIPLIPKLAVGTNYVPQDMFAYLHEGEAVVPKKYNPTAAGLTPETIEQAVYTAFLNAFKIVQASAKQDDKELVLKIDNTVLARMQLPAIIREGQRQGLNLVVCPQGV